MSFYDLNIPWPLKPPIVSSTPNKKAKNVAANLERPVLRIEDLHRLEMILDMAIELGYQTIAYNLIVPQNCFEPASMKMYNPCPEDRPIFVDRDPRYSKRRDKKKDILQLSRATVVYDESCISGQGNGRCFVSSNSTVLAGYDLLSILPLDAAAFSHAALNMSAPTPNGIDIITLDLASSPRLPFQLKRTALLQAISQGVMFEIVYGVALRAPSATVSKDARRNVMAGARELIRLTGGKGIILSGEVADCLEMRAPLDLSNLGALLGFKPAQARAAVSDNCRKVVMGAHSNRKAYRGTISQAFLRQEAQEEEQQEDPNQMTSEATGLSELAAENFGD